MDKYEVDPNKDTLFRGEFEVVKELIAAVADGDVSVVAEKIVSVSGIEKNNSWNWIIPLLFHDLREKLVKYRITI